MAYRNGNYAAFYVEEPFNKNNLGPHEKKDFVSYNLLRAWKKDDSSFPFIDSHEKNYNVRDGSNWETTLKPRIQERLNNSKNIILFLSSITKKSRALREEICFGIDNNDLPVIVVYPEYKEKSDIINCQNETIKPKIKNLWDNLPTFRDRVNAVPTLHIPYKKDLIRSALKDSDLYAQSAKSPGIYFYKC